MYNEVVLKSGNIRGGGTKIIAWCLEGVKNVCYVQPIKYDFFHRK